MTKLEKAAAEYALRAELDATRKREAVLRELLEDATKTDLVVTPQWWSRARAALAPEVKL